MAAPVSIGELEATLRFRDQFSSQVQVGLRNLDQFERRWTSASANMERVGSKLQSLGTSLLPVSLAIAGIGIGAVKAASDFESSFAGVRKTVDATDAEFAQMEAQFRSLAKTIPISVNELNRLGEAAGALGIPKKDIVGFSKVMAELGITTNLTADAAADAIARIQNIFGAAGVDTERFASTLVALGNAGASTEQDIIEMSKRIAGAGNVIGLTQAQVLGFASALSSVGIEAELGGTAISTVFTKIANSAAKGGEDLAEFARIAGVSTADFKQQFGTDAAGAVIKFIEGLGRIKGEGENLFGVLEELVGKNSRLRDTLLRASGAGELLRTQIKLGSEAWKENTALTEEAGERYKTFESQLVVLKNRIYDVGITLGKSLIPILKDLLDSAEPVLKLIAQLAEKFADLPQPVRVGALGLAGFTAAMGPMLIGAGMLVTAIGRLQGAMAGLAGASAAGSLGLLARAINPVTLGLTAIGGAALYAWTEIDKLKRKNQELIDQAKENAEILKNWQTIGGAPTIDPTKFDQATRVRLAALASQNQFPGMDIPIVLPDMVTGKQPGGVVGGGAVAGASDALDKLKKSQADLIIQARAWIQFAGSDVAKLPMQVQEEYYDVLLDVISAHGSLKKTGIDGADAIFSALSNNVGVAKRFHEEMKKANAEGAKDFLEWAKKGAFARADQMGAAFVKLNAQQREWRLGWERESMSATDFALHQVDHWVEEQMAGYREAFGDTQQYHNAVIQLDKQAMLERSNILQDFNKKRMKEAFENTLDSEGRLKLDPLGNPIHYRDAGTKAGESFVDGIDKVFKNIPDLLVQAFTGGGGLLGALKAIGVQIADVVVTPMMNKLNDAAKRVVGLGSGIAAALGGLVGGGAGATIGGLAGGIGGAAIGAASGMTAAAAAGSIAAMAGLAAATAGVGLAAVGAYLAIKKIFSAPARDMIEKFIEEMGGGDALHARLDALGAAGERMWHRLMNVGKKDTKEAQAAIQEMIGVMERAEGAMERLGLTLDDFKDPAERAGSSIQQLGQDLQALMGMGVSDPNRALEQMADTAKRLAPKIAGPLNDAFRLALETGAKLPASFKPFLEALIRSGGLADDLARKLLGLPPPDTVPWQDMEAAAERYGIKIDQLGDRFRNSKLIAGAEELAADWALLVGNGADVNAVMDAMKGKANDFLNNALKWGIEIPASMRPMLEAMLKAGVLVDENGLKLDNLDDVNWGIDLRAAIDALILAFQEMIDKILEIPSEVDVDVRERWHPDPRREPDPNNPDEYNPDNPNDPFGGRGPSATMALGGIVTRPTRALIGEAGPEAVIPLDHALLKPRSSSSGPVSVTVPITIVAWDGESVATYMRNGGSVQISEAIAPDLIRYLDREQLSS